MSRSECIRQEENKITVVTPNFVWEAFKRNLIPDPCCDPKPPTELSSAVAAHRIASDYVQRNIRGLGLENIQRIQALVAPPGAAAVGEDVDFGSVALVGSAGGGGGGGGGFSPPSAAAATAASSSSSSLAAPVRASIPRSAIENFLNGVRRVIRDDAMLVEHLGTMYLFGAHNLFVTLQRIIEQLDSGSGRGGGSSSAAAAAAAVGHVAPSSSSSASFGGGATAPALGGGGGAPSPAVAAAGPRGEERSFLPGQQQRRGGGSSSSAAARGAPTGHFAGGYRKSRKSRRRSNAKRRHTHKG